MSRSGLKNRRRPGPLAGTLLLSILREIEEVVRRGWRNRWSLVLLLAIFLGTQGFVRQDFLAATRPLTMHANLQERQGYEHLLLADATYQLGVKPRLLTIWQWQIEVRPAQPDLSHVLQDVQRMVAIAQDQPTVLGDVAAFWKAYSHLQDVAHLYWQAGMVYTPDYTPLQTWLDYADNDCAGAQASTEGGTGDGSQSSTLPQFGWN